MNIQQYIHIYMYVCVDMYSRSLCSVLLSVISVIQNQQQSEHSKWKIPEIKKVLNFNLYVTQSRVMKSCTILLYPALEMNHPFVQYTYIIYAARPLVTQ